MRRRRSWPACPRGPLGFSGQMHGLVTLDADGHVLRPAILWNDQRTAAECAEIEERIGLARLIELTGNRALTGFTAPKLLWLRRHEPHVFERIAHVLLPKDYVRLRLEGEHAIDAADASGTLLFDVAHRRWSDEVLAALDLPREWLPPAHESTAIAGAGDQAAGALGVGIDVPGPLSVALGTSGVVFGVLPSYSADAEARLHTFCHAVPGTWHAMGVMLSAAGSLRWLRDVVGGDDATLVAEAEAWSPGAEGLTFLPYLTGERTPHADPDARGAFVGLTVRHDRGALARAVLEGVAYGLRDSLELLRSLGVRSGDRPHLRRRRAQRSVDADRRHRARHPARADRGRRGRGVRRGAARRRALRPIRGCARGGRGVRARDRTRRAGAVVAPRRTTRATSASARSTRRFVRSAEHARSDSPPNAGTGRARHGHPPWSDQVARMCDERSTTPAFAWYRGPMGPVRSEGRSWSDHVVAAFS